MTADDANAIVSLWFSESVKPLWFNSTKEFDAKLEHDFTSLLIAEYRDYQKQVDNDQVELGTSEEALALVILFDQFPLNMYRGDPRSFETEQSAVTISRKAIELGFNNLLTDEQKSFLYMPFMHSENMADQDLAVELFEQAKLEGNIRFAQHHREIIRRFGRFPHRNEILGRQSTEDERVYLNSKEAFLG